VCVYLAAAAIAPLAVWAPRVFWTMLMPIVPLAVVVLGFHWWRQVCPIATLGSLGARLPNRKRRVPRRWATHALLIAEVILGVGLVVRHVATNGDGAWLGAFLVFVVIACFVTNAILGGRSFCHYVCPVGVVERIYTDGLGRIGTSRCAPCSGCKKSCADIDQDRAFHSDASASERSQRAAFYSFPGLVFAFYAYYWARRGTWEAFFDGGWARHEADLELAFGSGFFFAPEIPAIAAAPLTFVAVAGASFAGFAALERVFVRRGIPPEVARARVLALASFTAFNVFYFFAGQPTLRLVSESARVVAFVVPVVSTIVLCRRWARYAPEPIAPRGRALPIQQ
jgi:hypothetical protein